MVHAPHFGSGPFGRSRAIFWVRLSNQPEAFGVPGSRSDFLARVAQTARAWPPAGVCLVGLIVTPARCSQADAARAALPPYAARAAQPLTPGRTALPGDQSLCLARALAPSSGTKANRAGSWR